jgi:acetyl-CoA carboxylase biotin carboxyl carrier protein
MKQSEGKSDGHSSSHDMFNDVHHIVEDFERSTMVSLELSYKGMHLKVTKAGAHPAKTILMPSSCADSNQPAQNRAVSADCLDTSASNSVDADCGVQPQQGSNASASDPNSHKGSVNGGTSASTDDITAPLVGVFYAASSPEAQPFVSVGQHVKQGDVVCIIEAMKVMNEIKASHDGTVTSVPAQNGQMVAFGDVLMRIEA